MTQRKNIIYGMMFRPCSFTMEEHDKTWHSADHSVRSEFYKAYSDHIAGQQIVAGCAKIYIYNNYQKVKDWTDLEVVITEEDEVVDYYNYKETRRRKREGKSEAFDKITDRIDAENRIRHNPVTSVTDAVLDYSDGDFSITINGREHWWLNDDEVIIIADYIEKQLKEPIKLNLSKSHLQAYGWTIKEGADQKYGSTADIYLEHTRDETLYIMTIDDGNVELPGALFHVYVRNIHDGKIFEGRIDNVKEYYCMLKMLGFKDGHDNK